jgi:hypothetical protein
MRAEAELRFDRVLTFLPVFEQHDVSAGERRGGERTGKVMNMPWFECGREARELVHVLDEDGWIVDFDWSAWETKAAYYYRHPERLGCADIPTLRRLLTLHARKDQCSEGYLAGMIRGGHILEILRRVAALALEEEGAGDAR